MGGFEIVDDFLHTFNPSRDPPDSLFRLNISDRSAESHKAIENIRMDVRTCRAHSPEEIFEMTSR